MEERNEKLEIIKLIINEMLIDKGEEAVENLTEEKELRNDLGFDSFDLAELTVRIEEKTGIDVFEKGLVNSIKEVIDRILFDG